MELTLEHRLAWLAGVVDGEGTIVFWLEKQKYVRQTDGKNTRSLRMDIAICNTDSVLISAVVAILRELGVKHGIHMQPRGGGHKACWYVKCGGKIQVARLLTLIMPYLVAKRHRAELALDVIAHRVASRKGKQAHMPNPPEDDAWLMSALGDLKHLNRRGPVPAEERI